MRTVSEMEITKLNQTVQDRQINETDSGVEWMPSLQLNTQTNRCQPEKNRGINIPNMYHRIETTWNRYPMEKRAD